MKWYGIVGGKRYMHYLGSYCALGSGDRVAQADAVADPPNQPPNQPL